MSKFKKTAPDSGSQIQSKTLEKPIVLKRSFLTTRQRLGLNDLFLVFRKHKWERIPDPQRLICWAENDRGLRKRLICWAEHDRRLMKTVEKKGRRWPVLLVRLEEYRDEVRKGILDYSSPREYDISYWAWMKLVKERLIGQSELQQDWRQFSQALREWEKKRSEAREKLALARDEDIRLFWEGEAYEAEFFVKKTNHLLQLAEVGLGNSVHPAEPAEEMPIHHDGSPASQAEPVSEETEHLTPTQIADKHGYTEGDIAAICIAVCGREVASSRLQRLLHRYATNHYEKNRILHFLDRKTLKTDSGHHGFSSHIHRLRKKARDPRWAKGGVTLEETIKKSYRLPPPR